jgi:hypothetical protein
MPISFPVEDGSTGDAAAHLLLSDQLDVMGHRQWISRCAGCRRRTCGSPVWATEHAKACGVPGWKGRRHLMPDGTRATPHTKDNTARVSFIPIVFAGNRALHKDRTLVNEQSQGNERD